MIRAKMPEFQQSWTVLGLFGDTTKEQVQGFAQAEHIESLLDKAWADMRPKVRAKCLFAIAYDYLLMELEEYTEVLIDVALAECPEYVEKHIVEDMRENEDFAHMVLRLDLYFEGELGIMDKKEK